MAVYYILVKTDAYMGHFKEDTIRCLGLGKLTVNNPAGNCTDLIFDA